MTNAWESRCATLAEEIRAACAAALPDAELRLRDRSTDMLAQEEDPTVVPFYPIGRIYRFRVQERRIRHLFGWKRLAYRSWTTVVSFGMEEMWNASHWTADRGLWCFVEDPRLDAPIRAVAQRFALDHRLTLGFSATQKDP